jgi:hypothetical protein
MTRRSRCFGLSLEELDKKTLLSAGQLGHLAVRHHHRDTGATGYNFYFWLDNQTTHKNLTVTWNVFGSDSKASGTSTLPQKQPTLIQSGAVNSSAATINFNIGSNTPLPVNDSESALVGTAPNNPSQIGITYITEASKRSRRCMDSSPGLKSNMTQFNVQYDKHFALDNKSANIIHES